MANDADRYYLPVEKRHFTTDEMCDAFGIAEGSTLRSALRTEATPTQAGEILGAAIHVPTMKKVLMAVCTFGRIKLVRYLVGFKLPT